MKCLFYKSLRILLTLKAIGLVFWYGGKIVSEGEISVQQFFIVYTAIIFGGQGAGYIFGYSSSKLTSPIQILPDPNILLVLRPHQSSSGCESNVIYEIQKAVNQ